MLNICDQPDEIQLTDYKSGSNISLSSYQGKAILLSFLNINCGWCSSWLQHMNNMWQGLPTPNDIQYIGIIFNFSNGTYNTVTQADVQTKLASLGIDETFPLLMDKGQPNSTAAHYMSGFTGSVGFPYSYIICKSYRIVNKWNRLSTQHLEPLSFDSGDLDSTENFVVHRMNTLQHVKNPWDTVLVLDYSDTMNDLVTLGGVTKHKVEFLQDATEIFLNLWRDYAACDDKAGVVFFKSQTETGSTLLPLLTGTNVQTLISTIKAKTAGECTAMGAGLATAIDMLQAGTDKKFIVLFTDGMQNRNPLVCGTSSADISIKNAGAAEYPPPVTGLCWYGQSDGGQANYGGPLPKTLNAALNIAIHSIGIGIYGGWQDTLVNMSAATGGKFSAADTIWPNLVDYFITSLVEFYRGSSLQKIMSDQGTLTGYEQTRTFQLNRCSGKMSVLLDWADKAHPLTFGLMKDGKTIDLSYKVVEGLAYRIATLYFPHYQRSVMRMQSLVPAAVAGGAGYSKTMVHAANPIFPTSELISPEGTWSLIIRRKYAGDQAPVAFHMAILADDKTLEVIPEKHNAIFYTGEVVPLDFQFREEGKPLDRIYSAHATVRRPVSSPANLLYRFRARPNTQGTNMEILARSPEIALSLTAKQETTVEILPKKFDKEKRVTLFGGMFEAASVPGIYSADINIRGISGICGAFERVESMTFLVKARPDPRGSQLAAVYDARENRLTITIVPMDKFGNVVGAGYASHLSLTLMDEPAGKVTDNLDGSYLVEIPAIKRTDIGKKDAVIRMSGIELFCGSLDKLIEKSPKMR